MYFKIGGINSGVVLIRGGLKAGFCYIVSQMTADDYDSLTKFID